MGGLGAKDTPDVVRLALVEGGHEPLQLLPEARPHTVQLVGALAPPCHAGGRCHCCTVHIICILKQTPADDEDT